MHGNLVKMVFRVRCVRRRFQPIEKYINWMCELIESSQSNDNYLPAIQDSRHYTSRVCKLMMTKSHRDWPKRFGLLNRLDYSKNLT
jgi:hypothetical protein